MKDTELRKTVKHLAGRINEVDEKFKVRYCNKCKHDTLQEERLEVDNNSLLCISSDTASTHVASAGWASCLIKDITRFYCLTCGTLWEEKTVCKEVK